MKTAKGTFEGRKLGVLLTEGVDGPMLHALTAAFEAEGALVERIAEKVYGVTAADGTHLPVHHKINGAPSVVFDAVAVIASEEGIAALAGSHAAKSFVADAFAHAKFIGLGGAADQLFAAAGVGERDGGFFDLAGGAEPFAKACRALRFWDRVS
jgi:catalase